MRLRALLAGLGTVILCVLLSELPAAATTYEIVFRLQTAKFYKALDFTVTEGAAPGDFVGDGSATVCTKNTAFSGIGAWNHNSSSSNLRAGFANTTSFKGQLVLLRCDFASTGGAPTAGQFTITVTDFVPVNHSTTPVVAISSITPK